jgi:hypothetical protein
MDRFQNLGMVRDRQQRSTLERVDDDDRRFKVTNARRLIYEKNYAVDSKVLARFLQNKSLTPTLVRLLFPSGWSILKSL